MKLKRFLIVVVCFGAVALAALPVKPVVAASAQAVFSEASSAKAMCVLEAESGRVLYGKNVDMPLAMASTTKIFTALTVLENCQNLEENVAVDDRAVGIEGTSIYLRKGENLTVKELLLGMMLPSGNDAATALAYHVGKTEENFCKMMEATAQSAGATNTRFKNAHGLDADGHYTTARDIALVSAKALENPDFLEIATTKRAVISGNQEVKSRFLKNKNRLLNGFEGANGVKTGFTDNAGRCFVASAKRGDMQLVCSVLNCRDMFEEAGRLLNKGFENFELVEAVKSYASFQPINVEKGRAESVKVFCREEFLYPLTREERLRLEVLVDLPESVHAPVLKEQVVGKVQVYLDKTLLFETDILARDEVKKKSVLGFVSEIVEKWWPKKA